MGEALVDLGGYVQRTRVLLLPVAMGPPRSARAAFPFFRGCETRFCRIERLVRRGNGVWMPQIYHLAGPGDAGPGPSAPKPIPLYRQSLYPPDRGAERENLGIEGNDEAIAAAKGSWATEGGSGLSRACTCRSAPPCSSRK